MTDPAPTLHLIGHSHIDPVWLWQWPEGYQEIKATFRSALDRIAEFDDFVYTASSAAFYDWVERNAPEMFTEIKQRVAEGRWQVVGGWWVEPDCNLPCGESFARQALIGQRWFAEHLGVTATVGFNPDSFGHNGMLPQILSKSGLSAYVFMRPGSHEQGLPGRLFWWESDDGSRVLAFRIPYEYGSWGKAIDEHVRRCAAELKPPLAHMMCFYGVGDHGGGPTVENLESIARLREEADDLPRLVLSHPERFFAEARESGVDLPVVHTELQHHASGCYATHSGIKRWNRRAENLLLGAERLCAAAARVTGYRTDEDFTRAWKNVIFNQFHDLLPGTSIEPAYGDARDELGEAGAIAGRALQGALQSITWRVDVPQEEGVTPVVVWNPHSWHSRQPVELELARLPEDPAVIDDADREAPVQAVQSLATVGGSRRRAAFVADLPPLGYRLLRIRERAGQEQPVVEATDTTLDNGRLRLVFDPETGYLTSLFDHRVGVEVLRGHGARPEVMRDTSDTWAHGVLRFDDGEGAFSACRVCLVEQGPVKSVIRVESTYQSSRLTQDFALYRDLDYVDVRVLLDWREQFKVLKLRFPTNLHSPKATYEIPFGHVERPADGEEEPGQRWVDLTGVSRDSGGVYGLSLANDGKYSFDLRRDELSLTVLRSPIYAHHDPRRPDPDGLYSFQDQGPQRFSYRLVPHQDGWEAAGTVRVAAELNQPAVALLESAHSGPLPRSDSYLSIDAPNVVLSALKEAEDGGALIARCYETDGAATRATIAFPRWDRVIEAQFGACEIKTFRVPDDAGEPVTEVNLLEWQD